MSNKHLVIIGSGLAGYMLAKEWRKLDTSTPLLMISQDDGAFYSKPMLSNAITRQKTPEQLVTSHAEMMAEQLQATIVTNKTVTAIDHTNKNIKIDGEQIEYKQLVLATGAKPIMPPLAGDISALWQVNSLQDYTPFRQALDSAKSVLILGSGLIGSEFANDLVATGKTIQVVSMESAPLARLVPDSIGNVLQHALQDQGIKWHMSQTATAVQREKNLVNLTTTCGKTHTAEMILSAIGIAPDLRLAQDTGINTNRGIVVDDYLQTSAQDIYALGDCAEVAGHVQPYISPLLHCARHLAKNLAAPSNTQPIHYPVMPVTVKTPACPIVAVPPADNSNGQWHTDKIENSTVARYTDDKNGLHGFALANGTPQQRMQLTAEITETMK